MMEKGNINLFMDTNKKKNFFPFQLLLYDFFWLRVRGDHLSNMYNVLFVLTQLFYARRLYKITLITYDIYFLRGFYFNGKKFFQVFFNIFFLISSTLVLTSC